MVLDQDSKKIIYLLDSISGFEIGRFCGLAYWLDGCYLIATVCNRTTIEMFRQIQHLKQTAPKGFTVIHSPN